MTAYELHDLNPRDAHWWHEGYAWGLLHGIDRGWDAADEEAAAQWAPIARYVRGLGLPSSRTYAELEELRGDTSSGRPLPSVAECRASWQKAS